MRRIIAMLLCFVVLVLYVIPASAANEGEEKYGILKAEFSDAIGDTEFLNVMVKDGHLYANAYELAARLGFQIKDTDECVTIYDTENGGLPYTLTQFFYNDVRVKHMLCLHVLESYEAPFPSIHNEKGIWIPLEYALLTLNGGMLIIGDTVLIDMPERKITDIYANIIRDNGIYTFGWEKDFGYTDWEMGILGVSSHLINQFNGLLKFEGYSWQQLFLSLAMNSSSYDRKYGENIAMLICTESSGELERMQEEAERYKDIFSKKGKIGGLLAEYSDLLDSDVGAGYQTCSSILEDVKNGNSNAAVYNKAYAALEKAFDRQTWFSKTGGTILEIQKGISDALPLLDVAVDVAKVVRYGEEFASQDKFSVEALDSYLSYTSKGIGASNAVRQSMMDYSATLKSNLVEFSAKKFYEEKLGEWIGDLIKDSKVFGSQANMSLIAWDMASSYVPFISNGLDAAYKYELALYASVLQSDIFSCFQGFHNDIFAEESYITADNLYEVSQYSYLYLKSCYITRDAAIASLAGKRKEVKEQIQPLIDYQNSINADIAGMLVELKKANRTNEGLVYGFLPEDNERYLEKYSDEKVIAIVIEKTEFNDEDICNAIYEASQFAWDWFWDSSRDHVDEHDTYMYVDESGYNWEYKKVTYEGIHCVEDVVDLAKHYFTEDVAREYVNYKQWYVAGGKVYVSEPEGVGGIEADRYDIIIRKDSESQYSITMYEYFLGKLMWEPYEVHYKYVDGYWVFDHGLMPMGGGQIPINVIKEGDTDEKKLSEASPGSTVDSRMLGGERVSLIGVLCYADDGQVVLKFEHPIRYYGESGTKYEIDEAGIGGWEDSYYDFIDKRVIVTGEAVEANTRYHYRDLMLFPYSINEMDND